MHVHFIAIGGSAMHNLAIALKRKGTHVTGSDDEIFEPSKSRLAKEGILPQKIGWDQTISDKIDAIILGMHARKDNPELVRAQELGLKIYSYPEFIYSQTKDKIRIVIGGSHGKTTITSMLLHAMNRLGMKTDFLVGALLEGFDCMVQLSDAKYIVIEGDEYLSSPIDLTQNSIGMHRITPSSAALPGITSMSFQLLKCMWINSKSSPIKLNQMVHWFIISEIPKCKKWFLQFAKTSNYFHTIARSIL